MGKSYDNSRANSEISISRDSTYVDSLRSRSIPPSGFSVIKPIVSRNWNNNNQKNIEKSKSLDDILENTYESIDHPKMKKQKNKTENETMEHTEHQISFDLDENFNWTAAGVFEDLTKQSSIFLASSINSNPVIRLQKTVISPVFKNNISDIPFSSVSIESNNCEELEPNDSRKLFRNTRESVKETDQAPSIDIQDRRATSTSNLESVDASSYSIDGSLADMNDEDSNSRIENHGECKHDELVEKISLLQRVVDELKKKYPQDEIDVIEGNKSSSDKMYGPDLVIQNKLKAEQIRNKERIRMREKAKGERRSKSFDTVDGRNRFTSPDNTNDEAKSREPFGIQRNKLSKKKDIWKKHTKKRNNSSVVESSATDVSALSGDEDEKIASSDSTDISIPHMHPSDELTKPIYRQDEVGGYPNDYDRVPPLQPYPPYSNPIFTPAALHTQHNLIFHPPMQLPYGHFPMQQLSHPVLNNMNNGLPFPNGEVLNNINNGTNPNTVSDHNVALPKQNNSELMGNDNHSNAINAVNIVLPSGRGKARGNERIMNNSDLEKLEEAQEKARAKMKAFLDRADSEDILNPTSAGETVT